MEKDASSEVKFRFADIKWHNLYSFAGRILAGLP
jgi:hypothetical protein